MPACLFPGEPQTCPMVRTEGRLWLSPVGGAEASARCCAAAATHGVQCTAAAVASCSTGFAPKRASCGTSTNELRGQRAGSSLSEASPRPYSLLSASRVFWVFQVVPYAPPTTQDDAAFKAIVQDDILPTFTRQGYQLQAVRGHSCLQDASDCIIFELSASERVWTSFAGRPCLSGQGQGSTQTMTTFSNAYVHEPDHVTHLILYRHAVCSHVRSHVGRNACRSVNWCWCWNSRRARLQLAPPAHR